MKKLNLKIIGVYTFVEVLFALGLTGIVFIFYGDELNQIITSGEITGFTADELSFILLLPAIGSLIGILLSFIISFVISIKYKLGVINSIIALILGFVIHRFILLRITVSPGQFLVDSMLLSALIDLAFFAILGIGIYLRLILKTRKNMHKIH